MRLHVLYLLDMDEFVWMGFWLDGWMVNCGDVCVCVTQWNIEKWMSIEANAKQKERHG